jgi:hypothetical protein
VKKHETDLMYAKDKVIDIAAGILYVLANINRAIADKVLTLKD